MKRNFGGLQEGLGKELQAALTEPNPITRYLGCIQAAETAVFRMKEMVAADEFVSRQEEIHHFKHEAPEVYSQLFYYMQLERIEADRPFADDEAFRALLCRRKEEVDEFFHQHDTICRYYNQGQTHQDEHLFVRRAVGQWSGDEIGTFIAPDFTIGTYWVAKIKANDRLRKWVREELTAEE